MLGDTIYRDQGQPPILILAGNSQLWGFKWEQGNL